MRPWPGPEGKERNTLTETHLENVRLGEDKTSVVILDQTLLPGAVDYRTLTSLEEMVEAIAALRVRGAPAIGICAGYCMAALARQGEETSYPDLLRRMEEQGAVLKQSRPTAVNLAWAVDRIMDVLRAGDGMPLPVLLDRLEAEARAIHREDMEMCKRISEYGLSLLHPGDGVLTHCNAGPLATSRYGTGQGPFHLAAERVFPLKVFADETRPLLQGARLTAWELQRAGVDVTLICDNMASMVMRNGWVQACMVGCDRVAANGDVANKIGTSGVAILARHYGIPFYVLGPTSTIDLSCPDGEHIPIEERDGEELCSKFYAQSQAPDGIKCYNPAFDVTSHDLIAAIITEKGICRPPFSQSLADLFQP